MYSETNSRKHFIGVAQNLEEIHENDYRRTPPGPGRRHTLHTNLHNSAVCQLNKNNGLLDGMECAHGGRIWNTSTVRRPTVGDALDYG